MSKLNHTPKPWAYEITDTTPNRLDILIKCEDEPIGWFYTLPGQGEANARLAANSPDLLEYLARCLANGMNGTGMSKAEQARIKNLIESATGLPIEEVLK